MKVRRRKVASAGIFIRREVIRLPGVRKMILLLSPTWQPHINGATVLFHNLAKAFIERGERVAAFADGRLAARRAESAFDDAAPYPVFRFCAPPRLLRRAMKNRAFLRVAADAPAAVAVACNWKTARFLGRLAPSRRPPFIILAQSLRPAGFRADPAQFRRTIAAADFVVAMSSYLAGIVRRHCDPRDADKIRVIPPGVESPTPVDTAARVEFAALRGAAHPVLATVLNLGFAEKIDAVIRAISALRLRYPDIVFLVGGDGPGRPRLQKIAAECGVADCVRFVGFVAGARKTALLESADLFVLPSPNEGFGIVFLEAALCGVPAVGAKNSGAADAIANGKTGYLYDAENAADLAATIARALADSESLKQIGQAARARAAAGFQWDGVAERYLALISEARQNRRR